MTILIGVLLFFFGGFIGVCLMCIIQVGAASEKKIYEKPKTPTVQNNKE
ncbi:MULTISPECIES: DUF3789 domain-containing protein [Enterococcus]|uniref:DUF3789 domain-containing protein n=1 Tax=Enterococcus raffinosus TaxID=71452 RepID=A0AAW8T317_9ENTE|nr:MULTISPECIES: DUF3789 domain-containing protein [Enterococcus]MCO5452100.1 DUF3789 domain-containing protein [Enterococcus faecium]MDH5037925.1 DUF3789 domain-containing protein [Enterococcus faecalis]MDT2434087.1 DUF3789 domain-containing protein [Enterococcus avium]MDT2465580.1 DUF3789 domain-containing protein [Enterococcus avium]MDT2505007.1 DUF3789 domain-containing protein [Enterococcus avium]